VDVHVEVWSITPVDVVEVLVNGAVVESLEVPEQDGIVRGWTLDTRVQVPEGGWIAARAQGPSSRYVTDSYAFAQTSPVYVTVDGAQRTSAADAHFLADAVRALWGRVEDSEWRTDRERARFEEAVNEAIAVYESIAAGDDPPE